MSEPTEMTPRGEPQSTIDPRLTMPLICPYCKDILEVTPRLTPIMPEGQEDPQIFLVMFGCAKRSCAKVISVQYVDAKLLLVKKSKLHTPGDGFFGMAREV